MPKRKLAVFMFFLITFLVILIGWTHLFTKKVITVIFRYDDYSALSPTDIEQKIIDVFQANNLQITFGVIPFEVAENQLDMSPQALVQLQPEKYEIIKRASDAGIVDIALHGYSHQNHNAKDDSEFLGVDLQTQIERIKLGKSFVENVIGKSVNTFIPPWNTYDQNTISALDSLGFTTLSADRQQMNVVNTKINLLPSTTSLPQLENAIRIARISPDPNPIIVVLIHSYDFRPLGNEPSYPEENFSKLVTWLSSQKNIRVLSISQSVSFFRNLDADRFAKSKVFSPLNRLLPIFIQDKTLSPIYTEYNVTVFTYLKLLLFYALITILGIIIGYFCSKFLYSRLPAIFRFFPYIAILLTLIIVFVILQDSKIFLKGAVLISISMSFSLGVLLYRFRTKHDLLKAK